MWVADEDGRDLNNHWNALFNTNYPAALSLNDRVFCEMWPKCNLCEIRAMLKSEREEALHSLLSELKQSNSYSALKHLHAVNDLQTDIQELEEEAVDNERKLATAVGENKSLKREKKQAAAKIAELTAALEKQKAVCKVATADKSEMAKERDALLSRIFELEQRADESTRSPNDEANDRPASTSSS
ncbi:hypothetical protein M3Y99_00676200 [Aphelenchoides fujianensis]|nr:hypothetical protein M3Y99_00676200 [Aphelenchoides fujianensis]